MSKFLIVVDMQNDFVTGVLGTPEAQAIVPKVVEKIKHFDGAVLATLDTHDDNYLNTQEGKRLPVPHCIEFSEGCAIVPDVEDALYLVTTLREGIMKRVKVGFFEKSSFASPYLPEELIVLNNYNAQAIEEVTLIGVCTDICVISNAMVLKAAFPETRIVVDASCCAGTTPENHENALKAMRQCQIVIENWED